MGWSGAVPPAVLRRLTNFIRSGSAADSVTKQVRAGAYFTCCCEIADALASQFSVAKLIKNAHRPGKRRHECVADRWSE